MSSHAILIRHGVKNYYRITMCNYLSSNMLICDGLNYRLQIQMGIACRSPDLIGHDTKASDASDTT